VSQAEANPGESAFRSALERSRPVALRGLRLKYLNLALGAGLLLAVSIGATYLWQPPGVRAIWGAVAGLLVGLMLSLAISLWVFRSTGRLLTPERRETLKRGARATTNTEIIRAGSLICVGVVVAWFVWPPLASFLTALYAMAMVVNAIKYHFGTRWFGPESLDSDVYAYSVRHPGIEVANY
jgi:hypothetical protein